MGGIEATVASAVSSVLSKRAGRKDKQLSTDSVQDSGTAAAAAAAAGRAAAPASLRYMCTVVCYARKASDVHVQACGYCCLALGLHVPATASCKTATKPAATQPGCVERDIVDFLMIR